MNEGICPKCNKQIKSGAKFCGYCGSNLKLSKSKNQDAASLYDMIDIIVISMIFLIVLTLMIIILATRERKHGSFTDPRDSKSYKTVRIGNQVWMAENLSFKADSGCYAYENNPDNAKTYGYLYYWKLAKSVCPTGWYLPSDKEWGELIDYLGGAQEAGNKLKEKGVKHWINYNAGTNRSGFTALPGGGTYQGSNFRGLGEEAIWWTSSARPGQYKAVNYSIINYGINRDEYDKNWSFSVRCVKGN